MLNITPEIAIPETEIEETYTYAGGPGGQNVNKVSTAVQLRFDVLHSPSLSEEVRIRLVRIAGKRLTSEGVLVIHSQEHRSQERNRRAARQRLVDLIRQAADKPKERHKTRPTQASREQRLETKRRRGEAKRQRARPRMEDS